jgi:hypothetical protein
MKYQQSFDKYVHHLGQMNGMPCCLGRQDGIDHAVVIPCFAESRFVFHTLASLSRNNAAALQKCLILCVVNNRSPLVDDPEVIADNQITLKCLDMLVTGRIRENGLPGKIPVGLLNDIINTNVRLAYIDASSAGHELPDKGGGVGLARKIGLDRALTLLDQDTADPHLLYCLDADTLVQDNYLSAVQSFFSDQHPTAAHVSFAHQTAADGSPQPAIMAYEIFLRYYVGGLSYAESPYAFHTIGSTMICTADGYTAVRGMNTRRAGEDFYFLNKLAKLDGVKFIRTTTVYPSSRPSRRVPFGTGMAVIKYAETTDGSFPVYHPQVFIVLKKWLSLMTTSENLDAGSLMKAAECIHPLLESFLNEIHFTENWRRIYENNRIPGILKAQLHRWFDGFKTLKLINYLSRHGIAPIELDDAVVELLNVMKGDDKLKEDFPVVFHKEDRRRLLEFLRNDMPA